MNLLDIRNLVPSEDNLESLGTSIKKWNSIYVNNINGIESYRYIYLDENDEINSVYVNKNFDKLGINGAADDSNKFLINSDFSLFNHIGNGHQLKINKNSTPNISSILFQSNLINKAEIGLINSDDFTLRIHNGSDWINSIVINNSTGACVINNFNISQTPANNTIVVSNTLGKINDNWIDNTIARSSITITAGNGLTGGGNLTSSFSINMGTPSAITGTSTNNVTATSHSHKLESSAIYEYSVNASSTTQAALRYSGQTQTNGCLYGGTTEPTSSTRLNYDGFFYATRVYNATYSDYAECFKNSNLNYNNIKHRIVSLDNNQNLKLATKNSNSVIGVVSDNYGMLLGGTEEEIIAGNKIPVGLVGTLYVDSEELVNENNLFLFVYSGNDGKALIVPKGESCKYDGCIVGKIIDIDKNNNRYKILLTLK